MRKSKFQGLCAKIFQTSRHLGFKIFRNAMTFHMALDIPKWYSCVSIGGNGQSRQGLTEPETLTSETADATATQKPLSQG